MAKVLTQSAGWKSIAKHVNFTLADITHACALSPSHRGQLVLRIQEGKKSSVGKLESGRVVGQGGGGFAVFVGVTGNLWDETTCEQRPEHTNYGHVMIMGRGSASSACNLYNSLGSINGSGF